MLLRFIEGVIRATKQHNLDCDFDVAKPDYNVHCRIKNSDTGRYKDFYVRFDDDADVVDSAISEIVDMSIKTLILEEGVKY